MLSQCINSAKHSLVNVINRFLTQSNHLSNVIGIDFGGTNSVLSMIEGSKVRVIENAEGARYTPSFITYLPGGNSTTPKKVFGNQSKQIAIQQRENTFYGLKYFYGRRYDDELIRQVKKKLDYSIYKGNDNSIEFKDYHNQKHTLQSITCDYLSYLKAQAETVVGKPIHKAIVSIPRFINQKGRDELKDIMNKLGLRVIKFIDEPIAALFGYNAHMNAQSNGVLVISIGGLDSCYSFVTRINQHQSRNIIDSYKVKNELFDFSIGGEDFDRILLNYFTEKFQRESQIDLRKNMPALERASNSIENAKIELSQSGQSLINIPFIAIDSKNIPKHFNYNVSRSAFESLTDSLTAKIKANCIQIRSQIKKHSAYAIDDIILVGGTTRIPKIQSIIKEVFDNKPINRLINPEEAPSQGCAIISALIKDNSPQNQEINYIKKMPLSLGIETLGGKYASIISKGDTLPCEVSKSLITGIDNQPKIEVKFYLGERPIAKENKLIGTISLNIPLAARNSIKVQLIVSMNNNGDVSVGAIETLSKKSVTLSTNVIHLLNEDNVKEVLAKAKQSIEGDMEKVSLVNLKVDADQFIHNARIRLNKVSSKALTSNLKEAIERISESINKLEIMLCSDDSKEIHSVYLQLKKQFELISFPLRP